MGVAKPRFLCSYNITKLYCCGDFQFVAIYGSSARRLTGSSARAMLQESRERRLAMLPQEANFSRRPLLHGGFDVAVPDGQ